MITTVTKTPALRFTEFNGEWKTLSFGSVVSKAKAKYDPTKSDKNHKCIELDCIAKNTGQLIDHYNSLDQKSIKTVFNSGDILFGKLRPNLRKFINPQFDGVCSTEIWVLNSTKQLNLFVYYLIQTSRFYFVSTITFGSKMPRADWDYISSSVFHLPSLPEQQKIATFLSAVDKKIQLLQRKKELLEQYKKGVMQKLFSQEIRFKDEEGEDYPEWDVVSMEVVFGRIKRKNAENNQNVLTISAQQGLVNQKEYFNKSVAASDVTGYYLLKRNDFAYNKSYSKGYPMGAIKKLSKYDKGVVSTLYICFSIKSDDDSIFYERYLDNGGINHELHKIAQEGARNHGLLNLSVIEFFRDIKIPRPSFAEQKRIGQFLSRLSEKVEVASNHLTKAQEFKKGLLQQMFV